MRSWLRSIFLNDWQRKCLAIVGAVIVWFLVNNTIVATRTIPDVAVRVVNIPKGKTLLGMRPDGLLEKRITIAITGNNTTLEELKPTDIEVVLNAQGKGDNWTADINKRNLVTINKAIDLTHQVFAVTASPVPLTLSTLASEQVPIYIAKPLGASTADYQFIGVWPPQLMQTVTGPAAQVKYLTDRGVEWVFSLSDINKDMLDSITGHNSEDGGVEVSFVVPDAWKQIVMPFGPQESVAINDPRAKDLRIDFLRTASIALDQKIPISTFFPLEYSSALNPTAYSLETTGVVEQVEGMYLLTIPLYVRDVSRAFLQVLRNHLQLVVALTPVEDSKELQWSVQFINPQALEDQYVESLLQSTSEADLREMPGNSKEEFLRERFRYYLREFALYTKDGKPLELIISLQGNNIILKQHVPAQ